MGVEASGSPQEWIARGSADLEAVRILSDQSGPAEVAGFLLQQAVEKHLKGFLVQRGWALMKTHDLVRLVDEATRRDPEFARFRDGCMVVTEYYTESRYPPMPSAGPEWAEVREQMAALSPLFEDVARALSPPPTACP